MRDCQRHRKVLPPEPAEMTSHTAQMRCLHNSLMCLQKFTANSFPSLPAPTSWLQHRLSPQTALSFELRSAPSSPLGTAHPAAALQAVSCVWPEDARAASRHLPDTEISALRLEKWTAQPERQKPLCWDSCSIKKHENLRITDRNKEQRH